MTGLGGAPSAGRTESTRPDLTGTNGALCVRLQVAEVPVPQDQAAPVPVGDGQPTLGADRHAVRGRGRRGVRAAVAVAADHAHAARVAAAARAQQLSGPVVPAPGTAAVQGQVLNGPGAPSPDVRQCRAGTTNDPARAPTPVFYRKRTASVLSHARGIFRRKCLFYARNVATNSRPKRTDSRASPPPLPPCTFTPSLSRFVPSLAPSNPGPFDFPLLS